MRLYRIFLILFITLFLSAAVFIFFLPKGGAKKFAEVEIAGKKILVEVASDPLSRATGLSGRKNLSDFGGMIFLFEKAGFYKFWMKDMKFPIDIFWVKDGTVADLEEYAPAPLFNTPDSALPLYQSDVSADMVLETKAGFAERNNIRIGDSFNFFPSEIFLAKISAHRGYIRRDSQTEALAAVFKSQNFSRKILRINFSSQAPLGIWDGLHEEACEETDILMTNYFFQDKKLTPEEFDQELIKLTSINKESLKQKEDIGALEIAKLANYFNPALKAKKKKISSLEDIWQEIDKNLPVIVPLDAKIIANPHYGPSIDYHTVLAIGYNKEEIIVHDSGTKSGKNYRYPNNLFWEAISDLKTGEKNVVVFDKDK